MISDPRSLPRRIEDSFLRRLEALPTDTKLVCLVAAAEPVGDPALVWRAAGLLGIAPRRWHPPWRLSCSPWALVCASVTR